MAAVKRGFFIFLIFVRGYPRSSASYLQNGKYEVVKVQKLKDTLDLLRLIPPASGRD